MRNMGTRLILFCLIWPLVSAPATGQIGIKAGINLASQRQAGFTMQGAKTGLLAGVLLPIRVTDIYTLQPEVLYIQKGSEKEREAGFGAGSLVTTSTSHLELVLVSKIHLGEINALKPHVLFGPFASYMLSGTYNYGQGEFEEDIEDYRSLEFGYTLGAGTDLVLGSLKIYVDGRFSHSLTDVHNVSTPIWNRGFSFSAGLYF